jgi:hypothetical protein
MSRIKITVTDAESIAEEATIRNIMIEERVIGRHKKLKTKDHVGLVSHRMKEEQFIEKYEGSTIAYEFEEKDGRVLGGYKKSVLVLAANVAALNANLSATLPTPTFRNSLRDQHDSEGNITATKNTYADVIIVQDEYDNSFPPVATGNKTVWHKANVPSKAGADDLTRIESIALDALIP